MSSIRWPLAHTVHPRLRGEHPPQCRRPGRASGSSPLTRGTQLFPVVCSDGAGSSPLTRGTPRRIAALRCSLTVHPRLRGEHGQLARFLVCSVGSSPLTRGTRFADNTAGTPWRFIPAYAGNTPRFPGSGAGFAVHPRLRGEHDAPGGLQLRQSGSSPLTRGTQHQRVRFAALPGFIPAYAGNTAASPSTICPTAVHPRLRGEHLAPDS